MKRQPARHEYAPISAPQFGFGSRERFEGVQEDMDALAPSHVPPPPPRPAVQVSVVPVTIRSGTTRRTILGLKRTRTP